MQRRATGTPFKLRSGGSPFKSDRQRMVIKDVGGNRLVDVTKGKTTQGTYTYEMMYNDLIGKGKTDAEAKAGVQNARDFNKKKYGTHNPTAEGLTNNTVVTSREPDKVENIAQPGSTQEGSKMDTYSPQDTRMATRDYKISRNRLNKSTGSARRKGQRLKKNLQAGGYSMDDYNAYMSDPDNATPEMKAFMGSRRMSRLSDKYQQKQRDVDFYKAGADRSIMGAEQGVNPNKGRMIEYGDKDDVMTKAGKTAGTSETYISDEDAAGYDTYNPSTGGGSSSSTTTTSLNQGNMDDLAGGSSDEGSSDEGGTGIGGMVARGVKSLGKGVADTVETGANAMEMGLPPHMAMIGTMGAKGANWAMNKIMGTEDGHKVDFEGDKDPSYEPTWWDAAKSKFTGMFPPGKDMGENNQTKPTTSVQDASEVEKSPERSEPTEYEPESTNKFGGPKMRFHGGRTGRKYGQKN